MCQFWFQSLKIHWVRRSSCSLGALVFVIAMAGGCRLGYDAQANASDVIDAAVDSIDATPGECDSVADIATVPTLCENPPCSLLSVDI